MTSVADLRSAAEKFVSARLQQLFKEVELDEEVQNQLVEANKKLSKGKLAGKKSGRDPSKPKQPPNGFMRFMDDCRKVQKKETPSKNLGALRKKIEKVLKSLAVNEKGNVSSTEMSQKMGEIWRGASDAEKKGYNDSFEADKAKVSKGKASASSGSERKSSKKKSAKKTKGKKKPAKEETEDDEVEEQAEDSDAEEVVVDEEDD